jgi:quercetin dioxygenase-like cupin family protein
MMSAHSVLTAILTLSAVLVSSSARAAEPDALAVEWQGQKPCERLHEDDQIRILRCTFAPGAMHVRHSHPAAFTYVLSGGKNQIVDAAGVRVVERETGANSVGSAVPWHETTNVGDTTLMFLVVEMKYKN